MVAWPTSRGGRNMANIQVGDSDLAIIVMGLMLTDALLPKSRYKPELRKALSKRINELVEELQQARQHDNPSDEQEEET